ncbi:MAG TPA: cytochrome P450 [Acidimicrobiales bacterium]|nr:cytochrome P450 [Acidimicrobiales bacterium]
MKAPTALGAEDVDLSDLEFWTEPLEVREAAFAMLRAERPIAFFREPEFDVESAIPVPPGPGYYAITRHADVTEISRHPELYCSGQSGTTIVDLPSEFLEFFGSMINMDDPRHSRLRRIVSAAFNPRMVKSVEDSIQSVADQILDHVIERGECDFVTEIAARLPLKVICDMMGVPESDYDVVFSRSNIILSMGDPEYVPEGEDPLLAFLGAGRDLAQLMQELAAFRTDHPTDDLTSDLMQANVDGESLTHDELASFFILLLVAGNETTRNAISHGLWALDQHPDQRATWAADFEQVAPTAVEEIVRWATPVIYMRRTVTRPTQLSGHELSEGDKVILFYNSANRDESIFESPQRFDVLRSPNPHVGFGAAGPHFCLGAHLARREITVMFRELFSRVPDIHATAEPDRLRSNFINGIKHLPCAFTPRER